MSSRKVVIIAPEGATLLDVVGPWEVFCRASGYAPGAYEVVTASVGEAGPLQTKFGLPIVVSVSIHQLEGPLDTVLVAGSDAVFTGPPAPSFMAWLGEAAGRARRIGSVCTGAFYLGHAGLLSGRRATTHWRYLDLLAELFPDVNVEAEPLFVRDGAVSTSAGITAGIDLALALVEEDCGPGVAQAVARDLVVFSQRHADQPQLSVALSLRIADRDPIRLLQKWAPDNLKDLGSIEDMAAFVNMSPRNFSRLFKQETGVTPGAYLRRLRAEAAVRRLQETRRNTSLVADQLGFGSPRAMRRTVKRSVSSRSG